MSCHADVKKFRLKCSFISTRVQNVASYIFIHFVGKVSNKKAKLGTAQLAKTVAIGVNGIVKNAMIAHMATLSHAMVAALTLLIISRGSTMTNFLSRKRP